MAELTKISIDFGDTQPTTLLGMPLELLVVFVVGAVEIVLFWGFQAALPMLPIGYLVRHLVRRDFNAPRVALLWFRSSALDMEASLWGGASVPPIAANSTQFRGIA